MTQVYFPDHMYFKGRGHTGGRLRKGKAEMEPPPTGEGPFQDMGRLLTRC